MRTRGSMPHNGGVQDRSANEAETAPATLGDVLYGRPGGPLVTERSWVELVHAVAARDQMALHALYERAHRPVFTLTMRISRSRETAEELTLDVFHDVWRRAPAYDPANGTVLGWIMNQARSRAIDRIRHDQRQKRSDPATQAARPAPEGSYTHDALERKQQAEAVQRALLTLAPAERQAIETAFFGEFTYAQVAEKLDQPLGTIKTRIRAGLLKLRDALDTQAVPR